MYNTGLQIFFLLPLVIMLDNIVLSAFNTEFNMQINMVYIFLNKMSI